MPSSAQDGSGSVGGVEAQEGSPLVDAAPQAFRRARGEWSPVGECAQAGASSLFEMPWGRVAGAGAGVGSGASAASSGASESDSGTVAGDSGDAGASPFLRHVSISLREPGGGGGHMSLAAGDAGAAFAAPDACAASNKLAPSRAARAWSATSVATNVDHLSGNEATNALASCAKRRDALSTTLSMALRLAVSLSTSRCDFEKARAAVDFSLDDANDSRVFSKMPSAAANLSRRVCTVAAASLSEPT